MREKQKVKSEVSSSCHVSIKPKKSIEKKIEKLKICKNLFLSDLGLNKKGFVHC